MPSDRHGCRWQTFRRHGKLNYFALSPTIRLAGHQVQKEAFRRYTDPRFFERAAIVGTKDALCRDAGLDIGADDLFGNGVSVITFVGEERPIKSEIIRNKGAKPWISCVCPGVRTQPSGRPFASGRAWSLVVKPSRERPSASVHLSALFMPTAHDVPGRW